MRVLNGVNVFYLLIFYLVVVMGCAGSGLKPVPIGLDSNPTEQIQIMKNDLASAKSDKIDILSPYWFNQALVSYNKANELHLKGGNIQSIFNHLSMAHAQLDRAKKLAPISAIVLGPVTKEREKAIQAGADSSTRGFSDAEKEFLILTTLVENDERGRAERKSLKVKALFSDVELAALQDSYLESARASLENAKKERADALVPRTFGLAEKYLSAAEKYIKENRYKEDEIQKRAQFTLFMADRSAVLAREALRIGNETDEETSLRIEKMNFDIASMLGMDDLRDRKIDDQNDFIVENIERFNEDWNNMLKQNSEIQIQAGKVAGIQREKIEEISEELTAEESRSNQLAKLAQLDDRLESVAKDFTPEEAEVYRQGNSLVVRLKGASFPSGKSTISSGNFSTLEKITDSLKKFKNAKVIVEGHTDSTGMESLNQDLSERRAKAVSDYLVASRVIDGSLVTTKGYGYTRPIATNKTKAGRMKNRRIDIIIDVSPGR